MLEINQENFIKIKADSFIKKWARENGAQVSKVYKTLILDESRKMVESEYRYAIVNVDKKVKIVMYNKTHNIAFILTENEKQKLLASNENININADLKRDQLNIFQFI